MIDLVGKDRIIVVLFDYFYYFCRFVAKKEQAFYMNNSKSTLFGFILIAAILFGWMYFMTPSKEELAKQQHIQDSIRQARIEAAALDSLRNLEQQSAQNMAMDSVAMLPEEELDSAARSMQQYNSLRAKFGVFASASQGDEQTWTIENQYQKLTFSNKGGFLKQVELKDYKTYDSLPLLSFDPETSNFDLAFFSENRTINTSQLFFQPYVNGQLYQGGDMMVGENDSIVLAMRVNLDQANGQQDSDSYLEFVYTVHYADYMMDFDIHTVGMRDVLATNADYMAIDWNVDLMKQEKSQDRFSGESIYYCSMKKDDVDHLDEMKDSEKRVSNKLKWVSFKQRFFCNVIVADEEFSNANMEVVTNKSQNPRYFKTMSASIEVPFDMRAEENIIPMSLYFGPNHFKTLKSYDLGLQRQINLGKFFLIRWINYGVIAIFNWLSSYGWNYGIVILILTILIKLVLFPFAFKSYKSSAITRLLKPEMDAINAKYPKEEDAMKKQQAVMNLQRQAGVSPASGCVPALLQMPILFAVFRFFPASIELRQQPFLWCNDLSTYDSIVEFPRFLGMDHISLFCLLMTITTFIYTYVNNKQMDVSSNPTMKPMKWMMYLMPIMFFGIFNNYSAGLSYYNMLVYIITFIQMFIFRKMIKEEDVRATIEKNKQKPVKKSNFQKRLEEAQKQQAKMQAQQRR